MTTTPHSNTGPEQLELLLPASNVSARFRLSAATRRRGLRHIAEIRKQLDNTHEGRRAA
ncbi:MAG: hypothetical protein AAGF73_05645 [Actinomycetota bacterium]